MAMLGVFAAIVSGIQMYPLASENIKLGTMISIVASSTNFFVSFAKKTNFFVSLKT
jgi:hypothetical protein